MHHVSLRDGDAVLGLYRVELLVVREFVDRVADRLRLEEEDTTDPFALWERGMHDADLDDDDRDPLLDRLFPQVFPDDDRASAEHRRFSEDDLRRQKAREADLVITALDAAPVSGHDGDDEVCEVVVAPRDVDAWLRTLNATRLALALELDITTSEDAEALDALPPDDPRGYPYSVYEFLGEMQAILLAVLLEEGLPDQE